VGNYQGENLWYGKELNKNNLLLGIKDAENLNNVSLTMGEGDNKITFSVNVSSEGGGNSFSGKSEAEQQTVLAKLLFGKDNKNAEKSMKSLKANLLKLVIKSVNIEIDKYGKFTIKATSKVDPKEEDYKSLGTLVGQKAQNKENPKMSGYALEIMAEIMNMAAEARSEVIQMIIEAMEQNHIMWMEMLKQLAEKAYEDDIEEAAFIKQLMAKVDEGDVEGANAIAALLEGLGSKVILPSLLKAISPIFLNDNVSPCAK
jgi:hypothetical protein